MLKHGGIIVLGAVCAASTLCAQQKLSLDQAVGEAIEKNVGLLAEKANIAVAEAQIITARLRPNPSVSMSGDHLDMLGTGFNDTNGGGPPEYALRFDMPFERGGKRGLRTEAARQVRNVVELQVQDATRALALEIANLFVDAQLARESLNLANENMAYFAGIVEVNQARLKAGDIAEVELLRSKLALSQQRNVVRDAESRYRAALIRLQTRMGRAAPSMAIELDGDLRRDRQTPDQEKARELALGRRPDLLALRQDVVRAGAELNSQLAVAKADPTIGTEYRRQQGVNGTSNSMGFFVEFPLQVYSRNQGEIERARQQRRQAELRVRQLEIEVAGQVSVAHEQVMASSAMLSNVEGEMLAQAQEVRRVTEYAYRRGHTTLLELLDAQRAYNETLQGYNEARAAYARSLYELDSVTGRTVTQ